MADPDNGTIVQPPGSSNRYWLPANLRKTDTGAQTVESNVIVATGSELANDMEIDTRMSLSHAGFSAETPGGYRYSTSFKNNSLYGIYSSDQKVYSVGLKADGETYKFVSSDYITAANDLPDWVAVSKDGDETSLEEATEVFKKYQGFFTYYGSHVVEECFLGTRYQLQVERTETGIEKKEEFSQHVRAEYSGIFNATVDSSVKASSEYKEYLNQRCFQCKVLGGDRGAANMLAHSPTDTDKFDQWALSRADGEKDALLHIKTVGVNSFLERSDNEKHLEAAAKLTPAMEYLGSLYTFKGSFSTLFLASSGWVELSVTPLPGVTVRVVDKPSVVTTQTSQSSVRIQSVVKESYIEVEVIIVAPVEPVDVSFSTSASGPFGVLNTLSLSRYGSDKYRTAVRAVSTAESAFAVSVPSLRSPGRFGGTGALDGTLEVEVREYAAYHMALHKQAPGVSMKPLPIIVRQGLD
jgi:hypothetical protein